MKKKSPLQRYLSRFLLLAAALLACGLMGLNAADQETSAGESGAVAEAGEESITSTLTSPFMLPIYLCSVLLVAAIIERAIRLRRDRVLDPDELEGWAALIRRGEVRKAREQAQASRTVVGQAWARGLAHVVEDGDDVEEALQHACLVGFRPLQRRLQLITTLGVIAPLLGLLGTVTGMIVTFMQISIAGGADKARLAGGIGYALFTTAGGLLVSIPAIISSRYFSSKLLDLSDDVEETIHHAARGRHRPTPVSDQDPTEAADVAGPVRMEAGT